MGALTSEITWDVDARTVTFRGLSVRDFSQKKGSFSEKTHKSGGQRVRIIQIFANLSGKIPTCTHLWKKKVERNGNFDKMSKRGSFDDRLSQNWCMKGGQWVRAEQTMGSMGKSGV